MQTGPLLRHCARISNILFRPLAELTFSVDLTFASPWLGPIMDSPEWNQLIWQYGP